jgi:hypothetical protein
MLLLEMIALQVIYNTCCALIGAGAGLVCASVLLRFAPKVTT